MHHNKESSGHLPVFGASWQALRLGHERNHDHAAAAAAAAAAAVFWISSCHRRPRKRDWREDGDDDGSDVLIPVSREQQSRDRERERVAPTKTAVG